MRNCSKRFTLIELLIVLAITGAVLGVALPNLITKPAGILKKDAIVKIESAFTQAKLMAMASGEKAMLVVDIDKNLIVVEPAKRKENYGQLLNRLKNPELEDFEGTTQPKENVIFKKIRQEMDKGVSFEAEDEALESNISTDTSIARYYFYSDGEAFGPEITVVIGTQKFALNVDKLTGKPNLLEIED